MNTIFIDVDTTGLSITEDRIVKINLIQKDQTNATKNVSILLNPGKEITEGATAVHGLTNSMLEDESNFADIADTLFQILDGNKLVGYNLKGFDLPILVEHFKREGMTLNISLDKVIDLKEVYIKQEPRTLKGALSFYTNKVYTEDVAAMQDIHDAQCSKYNMSDLYDAVKDPNELDLAHKFRKNDNGDVLYMFGKYRNKSIEYVDNNDPSYNSWLLESTMFQENTKAVLRKYTKVAT